MGYAVHRFSFFVKVTGFSWSTGSTDYCGIKTDTLYNKITSVDLFLFNVSTFFQPERDLYSEPAVRGLLILAVHILCGVPHRADHCVQRNFSKIRCALQSQLGGCYSLYRPHRISLDTGYLHQSPYRVASKSKM